MSLEPERPATELENRDVSREATEPPSASMIDAEELRNSLQSMIGIMNPTELTQVLIPATIYARLSRVRSGE